MCIRVSCCCCCVRDVVRAAKAVAVAYIVVAFVLMARDLDVPGFSQGLGAGLGASIAVLYLLLQECSRPLVAVFAKPLQGSVKMRPPGCVNAAGKAR